MTSYSSPSPSPRATTSLGAPVSHPFSVDVSLNSHTQLLPNSDTVNGESETTATDADPQIIEALKSKDRLYVLKLGEHMEELIEGRRTRVDSTPSTSYQRLLVHRCSAYYGLRPETDPVTKIITIFQSPEGRIPSRRLSDLVPAESTAHPTFKIMRRSAQGRPRSKPQSHSGSVAGEDADLSDVEPSESGSAGGRSNATGGSGKKRMTIEEREAAYNEARSRIFMGFEEKEKEKDMNASSSSLSLVSGSSTSGTTGPSSLDNSEESVSSPATESEWSASITRDRKDSRHGLPNEYSRSLLSGAPSFHANGSESSRGSGASSPSFTYASLYEPPPASAPYDPAQIPAQIPNPSYVPQYMYPYPPPGQPHPQYIPPYTLYGPYPYQQNMMPASEPSSPGGVTVYSQTHSMAYENPYGWTPQPHMPPPMQHQPLPPPAQPCQPLNHSAPPLPYQTPYMAPMAQYPPPYPMPGYYPPPHQDPHMPQPIPHVISQPMFTGETGPRPINGNGAYQGNRSIHTNGCSTGTNSSRTSSRNSSGSGPGMNGGNKRNTAPPTRSAWSYGPGMGGFNYGGSSGMSLGSPNMSGNDVVVGPRLSSTMRRSSGASVGSGGNRASTGDEASSSASSSTASSSSRRTYTSTSSHHPLPPRPDWAVGLKPQPTLHPTLSRHHDSSRSDWQSGVKYQSGQRNNSLNIPRTTSPGQFDNLSPINMSPRQLQSQQTLSAIPHSTDFPPLTSVTLSPEKRTPAVAGAWTNTSTRAILIPGPGQTNSPGSVLVTSTLGANGTPRSGEADRGFEKSPPKGTAESNAKFARRPASSTGKCSPQVPDGAREVVTSAILVGQVLSLSLDDTGRESAAKEVVVCGSIPNAAASG